MNSEPTFKNIADITVRLAILALIVAWCVMLLMPFGSIILWSIILALVFNPLHQTLVKRMGGRKKLASIIIILTGLLIILVPLVLFMESLVDGVKEIIAQFKNGTLTIPPPDESVRGWPLIGDSVYSLWNSASASLGNFFVKYEKQIAEYGRILAEGLLSFGGSALQLIISFVIAGVLLFTSGVGEAGRNIFRKLMSDRGDEFADVAQSTVSNVVKGVLGVALIQTVLIGVGLMLAGIPYAGLWALLVMILSVLQIPATLITIPAAIYLFSEISLVPAILWSVYLFLAGISDNILKPLILGKGAPVPTLVIFLGVLGGFILSGFIGLFTGAIVLSVGYKLFLTWLYPSGEIPQK